MSEPILVWAAKHNFFDMVDARLKSGDDPNIKDSDLRTAIFNAVLNENTQLVQLLIGRNANLNIIDKFNKTPIQYSKPNSEIEIMLLNSGAKSREYWINLEVENRKKEELAAKERAEQLAKWEAERPEREFKELIERHYKFLETAGKPHAGIRKSNKQRPHRITNCWHCKGHLDNAIDYECDACSWILCKCGACGCGYGESNSSSPTQHYDSSAAAARSKTDRPYWDDDIPF